ncbi:hypothetical protein PF010_g32858 [Phytophthora fragariae]|uniref:RxLR effector protein n=1 Tax=Phytophthora fragariae TaxID=53985 RepID=A0A6A3PAH1_9STRA|nr:hypothetical protein PF003_g37548 [Phytophthora fragariae]KAE8916624.1 hypothetical protein PF009_g33053 [Phytophthora fragariae]KAE9053572.1 hypothetical protein PF010_g32858 [Phytophthora fragariae]KAE9056389.1 hypothetical protein PF006_g32690 [Phytophthora fragariae]KAE9270920.1 hypothetical protein PF008_g30481 [Phytophthora fragariae]
MPWSVTLITLAFVSAVVKDDAYLQQTSDVTPHTHPGGAPAPSSSCPSTSPRGSSSASPSCPESKSTPNPSTRASRPAIWQRSTVCPCAAVSPPTTSPHSCALPSAVRSRQPCCTGLKRQCGGYRMGPIRWADTPATHSSRALHSSPTAPSRPPHQTAATRTIRVQRCALLLR